MRTIKGGPAYKAGKEYSINVHTATSQPLNEDEFDRIINNPVLTRISGSSGWKNKEKMKGKK